MIVAATRFDQLKGTDLLVEVVAACLRAPDIDFVIAGGLPDNARAELRWKEAFRAALTPEQRPRLHFPGWLGPDALIGSYRKVQTTGYAHPTIGFRCAASK